MNVHRNKNYLKKMLSIAGVASTSVFLVFPAFALDNHNENNSNGCLTNYVSQIDSTTKSTGVVAQSPTENGQCVNAKTGSFICLNNPNPACGNPVGSRITNITPIRESPARPGSFACLNNPSSECGNPPSFRICP
ncbi:hypothetical protein [Coleofasciculus sp. H7-2]|uniref:hypothetical protein n=1 Tax=Coleofasciculus sp. H7-2 TaxID=3351545 RepID=UPI00366D5D8D